MSSDQPIDFSKINVIQIYNGSADEKRRNIFVIKSQAFSGQPYDPLVTVMKQLRNQFGDGFVIIVNEQDSIEVLMGFKPENDVLLLKTSDPKNTDPKIADELVTQFALNGITAVVVGKPAAFPFRKINEEPLPVSEMRQWLPALEVDFNDLDEEYGVRLRCRSAQKSLDFYEGIEVGDRVTIHDWEVFCEGILYKNKEGELVVGITKTFYSPIKDAVLQTEGDNNSEG